MHSLTNTLGNSDWIAKHANELRGIFPLTWTHILNLNLLGIGFKFKVIGIDWRSEEEFAKTMVFLEKAGIYHREGILIRRSEA